MPFNSLSSCIYCVHFVGRCPSALQLFRAAVHHPSAAVALHRLTPRITFLSYSHTHAEKTTPVGEAAVCSHWPVAAVQLGPNASLFHYCGPV